MPNRIPCLCPFSRKRWYFSNGRREIAKKGVIFRAQVSDILSKVKIWHVLISIYFSACLNCYALMDLSFSSELITNEKYGIHWKTFWVWYRHSHFHKQGSLSYITKKKQFCWKRVFCWASKPMILVEKAVFYSSKIPEKGVLFKLGCHHGISLGREWWGWEWGGVGGWGWGVGWGGGVRVESVVGVSSGGKRDIFHVQLKSNRYLSCFIQFPESHFGLAMNIRPPGSHVEFLGFRNITLFRLWISGPIYRCISSECMGRNLPIF